MSNASHTYCPAVPVSPVAQRAGAFHSGWVPAHSYSRKTPSRVQRERGSVAARMIDSRPGRIDQKEAVT